MKIRRMSRVLVPSVCSLLLMTASGASAQDHDHAAQMAPAHKPTPEENALVEAVRGATERFRNVTDIAGPGEGYDLSFGCVSGGDFGAMGLHYVNMALVGDGEVDASQPEIILFEPTAGGGIRITGVDFLVLKSDWEANPDHKRPPSLGGQLFHLFDAPNRFGLDPFYTLHVWAWKDNPNGTFGNWNPDVSCNGFNQGPLTSRP